MPATGSLVANKQVDYDRIAPEYNRRFAHDRPADRGRSLVELAETVKPDRVLEVACGTGHWLAILRAKVPQTYGLDLSLGMLRLAHAAAGVATENSEDTEGFSLVMRREGNARRPPPVLSQGRAGRLPYRDNSLDMAFCVNAIHHFGDPHAFVSEVYRVLRPGGTVAIVGSDPHSRRDSWYVYQYFDTTYATDLDRFPTWPQVADWLGRSGFENVDRREVERVDDPKHGREVLDDPYLRKDACSQLTLLTDGAYAAGLNRIRTALADAEERQKTIVFRSEFAIEMLSGIKSADR